MFINNHTDETPGLGTHIAIDRWFFEQTPYQTSNCYVKDNQLMKPFENNKLVTSIISSNLTYTQNICINICLQNLIYERCSCIVHIFHII